MPTQLGRRAKIECAVLAAFRFIYSAVFERDVNFMLAWNDISRDATLLHDGTRRGRLPAGIRMHPRALFRFRARVASCRCRRRRLVRPVRAARRRRILLRRCMHSPAVKRAQTSFELPVRSISFFKSIINLTEGERGTRWGKNDFPKVSKN